MAGWDSPLSTLEHEFLQAHEEGRDPKQLEALRLELATLKPDLETLEAFHPRILAVPVRADFPSTSRAIWRRSASCVLPPPSN